MLAALPFVAIAAGLIVAVGGDYHPAGDLAMTEMHTRDIGHHEVLTGLHSRWNWSHPGPLQFYVSAPIYRLSGSAAIGMLLAGLAVNLAAVVGSLVIARRRGGTALVLCTLLGCLLLARTLGPGFLADNYNLTLTVFPFVLLAFVAWSIWAGETWAIPVGAFVVRSSCRRTWRSWPWRCRCTGSASRGWPCASPGPGGRHGPGRPGTPRATRPPTRASPTPGEARRRRCRPAGHWCGPAPPAPCSWPSCGCRRCSTRSSTSPATWATCGATSATPSSRRTRWPRAGGWRSASSPPSPNG